MIREAVKDDLQSIAALGERMTEEGRYKHVGYDFEKVSEFISWYIESPDNLLLVSEINGSICGFFFGYVTDYFFSNKTMSCEELWYMAPEFRGRRDGVIMIKKFINWSKSKCVIEMSAGVSLGVDDDRAGKVLVAMGFHGAGASYKLRNG